MTQLHGRRVTPAVDRDHLGPAGQVQEGVGDGPVPVGGGVLVDEGRQGFPPYVQIIPTAGRTDRRRGRTLEASTHTYLIWCPQNSRGCFSGKVCHVFVVVGG